MSIVDRSIPEIVPEEQTTTVEPTVEETVEAQAPVQDNVSQEEEAMLNFAISQEQEMQKELDSTPVVQTPEKVEAPIEEPRQRRVKEPEFDLHEGENKKNEKSKRKDEDEDDRPSFLSGFFNFIITLLLLAALLTGAFFLGRITQANSIQPKPTITPIPTATPKPAAKTVFEIENLSEYVASIKAEDIAPFKASVEKYYGFECLAFSADNVTILYRNEYPADYEGEKRIVVDNGMFRTEINLEYNLQGDASALIPQYGAFGSEGTKQLVFVVYNKNLPEKLWFVDADKLFNYGSVDLIASFSSNYKTSFEENPAAEDTSKRYLLKYTYGTTEYIYNVSKDTFITGEHDSIDVIDMTEGFELVFGESSITFSTLVKSAENEYLGKITGSITQSGNSFKASGVKYNTFAISSQAGYSEDGIITPRPTPLTTYVTIIGKTGQRYLLPISDEVTPIDIDWSNMVVNDDGTYDYVVDGKVQSIKGIDVSKFQGNIEWDKVKEAGIEFVIIRLGYRGYGFGTLELDEKFKQNIEGANEVGIKVGIYFFSEAITVEEAVEEAEFVLENIKDYVVEYPIVFDTEDISTADARANNLTYDLRTQIVRAFCDTIKAAGYTPMIYANSRYMLTAIDLTQLNDIDRWFAYYGTSSKFPYSFNIFQYSETGKVDGIPVGVDLDISFVDYSKLQPE